MYDGNDCSCYKPLHQCKTCHLLLLYRIKKIFSDYLISTFICYYGYYIVFVLQIVYHELIQFIEANGISIQSRFLGYQRQEISGLMSFFGTLQNALLTNVKKIYVQVSCYNGFRRRVELLEV
jgi:hypothetical protein